MVIFHGRKGQIWLFLDSSGQNLCNYFFQILALSFPRMVLNWKKWILLNIKVIYKGQKG